MQRPTLPNIPPIWLYQLLLSLWWSLSLSIKFVCMSKWISGFLSLVSLVYGFLMGNWEWVMWIGFSNLCSELGNFLTFFFGKRVLIFVFSALDPVIFYVLLLVCSWRSLSGSIVLMSINFFSIPLMLSLLLPEYICMYSCSCQNGFLCVSLSCILFMGSWLEWGVFVLFPYDYYTCIVVR